MIRCPTLRTISASLLELDDTTLLVVRKFWYSVLAIDCSSDSGTSLNWLLPVTAFLEQATTKAERIKKETGVLTGAVGLITTASQAEQILVNQQADIIIMARQLLRDPYFPLHAAKELGVDIPWPLQYERAKQ